MTSYIKDFSGWSQAKPLINQTTVEFFPKEREVWFVSLGVNIGSESDGKTDYRRPVIVLRKIGSLYFCVPLTTKHKDNIGRIDEEKFIQIKKLIQEMYLE